MAKSLKLHFQGSFSFAVYVLRARYYVPTLLLPKITGIVLKIFIKPVRQSSHGDLKIQASSFLFFIFLPRLLIYKMTHVRGWRVFFLSSSYTQAVRSENTPTIYIKNNNNNNDHYYYYHYPLFLLRHIISAKTKDIKRNKNICVYTQSRLCVITPPIIIPIVIAKNKSKKSYNDKYFF